MDQLKSYQWQSRGSTTWKDMLENALRDTASWLTTKWSSCTVFQVLAWVITNSKREELESDGELSPACSQNVVKCLYLARSGRPDILWSVDKRHELSQNGLRLVTDVWHDWFHTFIPHDYRQHCLVAQHCRLELFQDSDFAEDLEDSNSASGGVLSIFESPSVEWARNRRQHHIVPQNLKSFLWMLDCEWMDYLLSTSGTS